MSSRDLDEELQELLDQAISNSWNEYCNKCFQNESCCNYCDYDGQEEPTFFESASDAAIRETLEND